MLICVVCCGDIITLVLTACICTVHVRVMALWQTCGACSVLAANMQYITIPCDNALHDGTVHLRFVWLV